MDTQIKSSSDILRTSYHNRTAIGSISNKLNRALQDATKTERYTRPELDATGMSRIHDSARAMITRAHANETTIKVTYGRLITQQQALSDINKIMVRFQGYAYTNSKAAGTNSEKADKALKEIETIFRRRSPLGDNEYVFGGNDPFTDPLSLIDEATGKRVSASLVKTGNLVNGNMAVNNYSDTTSIDSVVTASSRHEIKRGFLYPGMEAMVQTIGYLNMFKEGTASIEDLRIMQEKQEKERGTIGIMIDFEINKINSPDDNNAINVNSKDIADANNTLRDSFTANIVANIDKVATLKQSHAMAIDIHNINKKATDTLISKMT
jgi:hypothetical protein